MLEGPISSHFLPLICVDRVGTNALIGPAMRWTVRPVILSLIYLGIGPAVWADPLALVRGVRIEKPAPPPAAEEPLATSTDSALLPDLQISAGLALLHRKGCIKCHDLTGGGILPPRGPRLDDIARKADPDWLRQWLEDPFAYLPASKMPRLALAARELEDLHAFLQNQMAELPLRPLPSLPADPYQGARLFQERACQQCHSVAGEGGTSGPALDRIGLKTSRRWLYSFLRAPHPRGADSALTLRQALHLSAFLVRRFAAGRKVPDDFAPAPPDSAAVARGLTTAVKRSCFQCHAITRYMGPALHIPTTNAAALRQMEAHRQPRGIMPPIALHPEERRVMALALQNASAAQVHLSLPDDYWQGTIALQGTPPRAFSLESQRLEPEACSACHVQQWRDWQSSRHARALSPGLLGQLADVRRDDPALAQTCLTCHAPLAEQYRDLLAAPTLAPGHGVTCVACHVRAHRYFGPPPHPGRSSVRYFTGGHHGVAVASAAFQRAEFCAPCHQFAADGFALNGTLLQNTYQEWAQSPQAQQDQTCQTCHMPDGRHLSRGIHDRAAVADALELDVQWQRQGQERLSGVVRLHNRGAGHFLPTYVTPALFVRVALADTQGDLLENTDHTRAVQRRLALDQSYEVFDTRIPPGGTWIFSWSQTIPLEARFLNVRVEVDPDFFYRNFFAQLNARGEAAALIEEAHAEIADSPYILFTHTLELE